MFWHRLATSSGWLIVLTWMPVHTVAEEITLAVVRSALRSYLADYRNAYHVTLWEMKNKEDARPTWWKEVTYHQDDLGRVRMGEVHGEYDARGQRIENYRECFLYNGEITARYDYNYDPAKGNFKKTGKETWVCVKEGREGILGANSPFKLYENPFLRMCEEALKTNQQVQVTRSTESPDVCIVEATRRFVVGKEQPKVIVVRDQFHVNVKAGVITQHEAWNADGVRTSLAQITYRDHAGIVFPSAGSFEDLTVTSRPDGTQTTQLSRSTFKCLDFKYNDPQFPKDVFNIVLPKGAFVWDTRFKVEYRVGKEKVIENELNKKAQEAIQEQQADPTKAPYNQLLREQVEQELAATGKSGNRWWVIAIGVNAVIALFLVGGSIVRRYRMG